jgi:hypothetical protein
VAECRLIGRWRLPRADLQDRDYLDLVQPAYLQISTAAQHRGGSIEVIDLAGNLA